MNEVNQNEIWQISVNDVLYETNFEELTQWISEGALMPKDKVRRGNLRWIEAGKVPLLYGFFNAKELGATPPVITTTKAGEPGSANININQIVDSAQLKDPVSSIANLEQLSQNRFCILHSELEAQYFCPTCTNSFCGGCPKSIGGGFKNCPMCGALCESIVEIKKELEAVQKIEIAMTEGFGILDFGRALVYPFKFKVSLFFGAVLFMFFSIGQSAASLGGRWLITAAIVSGMLANMLTFGILSNTVENMLQGKNDRNFMPSFDEFGIWDDVIQPFFLSLGVYISAFLPLILLIIAMFFLVASSIKNEEALKKGVVPMVAPELLPNYEGAKNGKEQIDAFKEIVKQRNEEFDQRMKSVEDNQNGDLVQVPNPSLPVLDEEKQFEQYNEMIKNHQKRQLESTIGQTESENDALTGGLFETVKSWALPFFVLALIFGGWGLFYLPVAYIVAAYTRNLVSVLNPAIGLDTIKRLGFDYVKILFFGLLLLIFNSVISFGLSILLSPFNLPRLGNIPVIAFGSVFTFYFSIVFSMILGYALFKNSDKFKMYQSS